MLPAEARAAQTSSRVFKRQTAPRRHLSRPLTLPVPGARRSRGRQPKLQGLSPTGTPCRLHPLKLQRPALIEGMPADAHPLSRCCSHRSSRLRHRHSIGGSARSQPAAQPIGSVSSQGRSPRWCLVESSSFSHSYGPISSPRIAFCTARLTHVHRAFNRSAEQRTV